MLAWFCFHFIIDCADNKVLVKYCRNWDKEHLLIMVYEQCYRTTLPPFSEGLIKLATLDC
jgi:hypothetical protein